MARSTAATPLPIGFLVPYLAITGLAPADEYPTRPVRPTAQAARVPKVQLAGAVHRPVDALPYGIQKIVGFARALAMEPRVLLLDEPSAGLNREEREDLARHILRIRHELRIAMVWVEHDMQMVADLADRICVLESGTPIASGTPDEVLNDPRVIRAYLGSAEATTASSQVRRPRP